MTGFEVKQVRYRDETYVGYVNKESDGSASRASTGYRTKDGKPDGQVTAFFGALLDAIAVSDGPVPTVSDQDAYYMPIGVVGGIVGGIVGGSEEGNTLQGATPSQSVPNTDGSTSVSMSMGDRQKALDGLVAGGWLSREGEDRVGLGPRSLLELHQVVLRTDGVSDDTVQYVNSCLGL